MLGVKLGMIRVAGDSPLNLRFGACWGPKLSYMLIDAAIKEAKRKRLLMPVRSVAGWAGEKRAFLMCKPLHEAIQTGKALPGEKDRQRWAALEGAMIHFVEGGLITRQKLKPLEEKRFENWELVNKKPRPSLRIFGSFAKPNVFVGTHVELRNKLGGFNSVQFEIERIRSEEIWEATGLPMKDDGHPHAFTDAPNFRYSAYITENAREKVQIS